jgi:cell division protein FtsQ
VSSHVRTADEGRNLPNSGAPHPALRATLSPTGGERDFFRPQIARPRNQRRIQVQRLLVIARNVFFAALAVAAGVWVYGRVRSESFAVKTIEIVGAVHTPRPALDLITGRYVGLNLFDLDIVRVQSDLGGLPWVSRIDIEKKVPDTLRIKIVERKPVALVRSGDRLLYADENGVAFAELSPAVGDDDLPVIADAAGAELTRTIAFLTDLRRRDPSVYTRISEVRPVPPRGFAVFDRQLKALVYVNAEDVSAKWRSLYSILDAERRPPIAYADLRFADRVVIKPSEGATHVTN